MIYIVMTEDYDDATVHAVIDGPPGQDLDALQVVWALGQDVAPDRLHVASFVLWLSGQPGFRELGFQAHVAGAEEEYHVRGYQELAALWGPTPPDGTGCDRTTGTPQVGVATIDGTHHWHEDTLEGRRVWACYWCHTLLAAPLG